MNPHYAGVAERAVHRCEYCHAPEAIFDFRFEVEHITPPLHGGTDVTWAGTKAVSASNASPRSCRQGIPL